jgi:hypothetical protein
VLAIEPEPELVPYLHERRDVSSWLTGDRLQILTAPEFAGAAECWRWFDPNGEEPPLVVNAALERIRPEGTESARQLVARLRFNAKANADARRKHGGRYLLNTLRNIRALARESDVASLMGAARGVPAIVVAAGPSLDANIEALRDAGVPVDLVRWPGTIHGFIRWLAATSVAREAIDAVAARLARALGVKDAARG